MDTPNNKKDLRTLVGTSITLHGIATNTKESAVLLVDSLGEVPCRIDGVHWSTQIQNQSIEVTGSVSLEQESSFPIAAQGPDGAWSQGVSQPNRILSSDGMFSSAPQVERRKLVLIVHSYELRNKI